MVENDLKVGNWWLSITYQDVIDPETKKVEKRVAELFVEDPRWIRILADEKGCIRSDQYFCPKCYKKDIHYTLKPEEIERGITPTCPTCDGPLAMTAYLQEVHGEITSRWGIDEMIHGFSTATLARAVRSAASAERLEMADHAPHDAILRSHWEDGSKPSQGRQEQSAQRSTTQVRLGCDQMLCGRCTCSHW
jgi:hypothetical protein